MRLEAAVIDDQYVGEDGRSVVLVGQDVILVSPLATVLLAKLEEGSATLAEAAAALADAFGPPPEGSDLAVVTEGLARDLAQMRVVTLVSDE